MSINKSAFINKSIKQQYQFNMDGRLNIIQANTLQSTDAYQNMTLRKSSPKPTKCLVEF